MFNMESNGKSLQLYRVYLLSRANVHSYCTSFSAAIDISQAMNCVGWFLVTLYSCRWSNHQMGISESQYWCQIHKVNYIMILQWIQRRHHPCQSEWWLSKVSLYEGISFCQCLQHFIHCQNGIVQHKLRWYI